MDFNKLKKDLLKKAGGAVESTAKKLSESNFTIKSKKDLDLLISKSKEKSFTSKETWEKKVFKKKSILVIWDEKSSFFKKALVNFPVLYTKAFSQSIEIKLSKSKLEWIDFNELEVNSFPAVLVFMDEKVYKIISGEENIQKLVKSFNLDINKEIENF